MSRVRIVLGNDSLASYPQGGGHWTCFLQYLFGLDALGQDLFWLEILRSSGNSTRDQRLIQIFFGRLERYGFRERCALLLYDRDVAEPTIEAAQAYGASVKRIREIAQDADLLWNFACSLRQPLLSLFKRRVLIDLDPGHLQVSALTWNMGIHDHHAFLTVGTKLHDVDCGVPTLQVDWHRFLPFVYLPMWNVAPDPGPEAAFSSITQWTWEELQLDARSLSVSKRDAYMRYLNLPKRAARRFELAANIHPQDATGDRELLLRNGWNLVHPHSVARSPAAYQAYIRRSRAEIQCPKPIHWQLNTGWFSDRSACYLASGRPVLAEDTGFSNYIPTGKGLLSFRNEAEALARIAEIDENYNSHMRAARELAESYFNSRSSLPSMLAACS